MAPCSHTSPLSSPIGPTSTSATPGPHSARARAAVPRGIKSTERRDSVRMWACRSGGKHVSMAT